MQDALAAAGKLLQSHTVESNCSLLNLTLLNNSNLIGVASHHAALRGPERHSHPRDEAGGYGSVSNY
jgi:hypothetical protein